MTAQLQEIPPLAVDEVTPAVLPSADAAPAALALRGVSKSHGSGARRTPVLTDINLEIPEGEFVAIVGFSGSGKTTLISLMSGLERPDSGDILLKGRPVTGPAAVEPAMRPWWIS